MGALLEYEFRVIGAEKLKAALSAQRAVARRHNQQTLNDALETSRRTSRVHAQGSAGGGASEADKATRYWQRAAQKSADYRLRQEEKVAREQKRNAERDASNKRREADKLAREQKRNLDRQATQEKLSTKQTAREQKTEAERAARTQVQEAARVASKKRQDEARIHAEQRRNQRYWDQAQKGSENARIRAAHERAAVEARTLRQAHAIGVSRADKIMGVGGRVMGTVGTVGRMAIGGAALAGGMAIGAGVMQRLSNTKVAADLAAQAKEPGRAREVLGKAEKVTGFETGEALAALTQWQTITGQLDTGLGQMQAWADLADDTSAGFSDIASAAGTMFVGFEAAIPDTEKRLKAVSETMRAMAAQGTAGSLELKDLSIQIGEMWGSAKKFGLDPVTQMRQMGAFAQVVKGAGGLTAPEAITTIQRMPDDIVQNQKKFQAAGIKIWLPGQEGHKMRELSPLLGDIFAKTGGRVDKIMDLGFDIRSKRGVEVMAEVYSEAEKRKKGTGRKAVTKRLSTFENLTRTEKEVAIGAAGRRGAEDKQFMERMRKLNRAVGEAAVPELNELQEELVKLVPTIARTTGQFLHLVNWMVKNPWPAIGGVILFAITKSIAEAAIGNMVKTLIAEILIQAAGRGGAASLAAGAAQVAGGAGAGAAARTGVLGKLGLAAGGGAAALGGAAAAALAGSAAFVWQASELSKQVGGTFSALDVIPGFEGGKFSMKGLGLDIVTGVLPRKLGKLTADVLTEDERRNRIAKEEYERRKVYQGSQPSVPQPGTQGPGTGYGIRATEEGGPIAAQKVSPGLDKAAAAEAGKIIGQAAAQEIRSAGLKPNTSNSPSAVKPI